MKDKKALYAELVRKRKACDMCQMMHNPSVIKGGIYDTDHIGPWSAWKGDLDAEIVVVGKDWYPKDAFIEQKGISDPESPTNKNLTELLDYCGVNVQNDKLFFTNTVLCMKEGKASDKLSTSCINTCSEKFLKPLLDIIEPKIVIALGKDAFRAIKRIYKIRGVNFTRGVKRKEPIYLSEKTVCFPVYHCGQYSVNTQGIDKHKEQWKRIRDYLEANK